MGLEDLLYKDYQNDHKFTLATFSPPGASCVHILLEGFSFLLMGLVDRLYKDYQNDHKFTLTTLSPTGHGFVMVNFIISIPFYFADIVFSSVAITSSGTKKASYNHYSFDEPAPGLKPIFSVEVPDQRSRKTITSSRTKKGELLAADVNTRLKNKNIAIDIKVDISCNVT
ncbi:hypothetical protein SADUNF_Sadunf15G0041100 [Salix dunnii]|uniref:Uncharacterized protein n=1 Tax=Salix dunnii TaxID=1413687 RepID=A0A835JDV2_9ROSI|nr:hypothetical protein SADUNF_Sadunf15G0041100 [Salix dunnii]